MSEPIFVDNNAGGYTCASHDCAVVIGAERVRWHGDTLNGEIRITLASGSIIGPLDISFLKPTSRRDVIAAVDAADSNVVPVVNETLNTLCHNIVECERGNTSPIVTLSDQPKPTPDRDYVVPVLPPLPRNHMSIWFGDGGTGKSVLALYAAGLLARQGLNVLYLDWELEQDEQRLRYEQLFGSMMPKSVKYQRGERPLTQTSDAIRRTIAREGIDYVVVDSIAYACGGPPESAEIAASYYAAVRSFGVGSLHLAHLTKSKDEDKPFGSVFWHNSARSTWLIKRTGVERKSEADTTRLDLWQRKNNFGSLEEDARRVSMTITKGRGPIKIVGRAALADSMSAPGRVRAILHAGGRTRDDLKSALPDIPSKTVNKAIERGLKDGWLREFEGVLTAT